MKIKYKHQRFQTEAAQCVTEVFQGQPKNDGLSNFLIDQGKNRQAFDIEGFGNAQVLIDSNRLWRIYAGCRWRKAWNPSNK